MNRSNFPKEKFNNLRQSLLDSGILRERPNSDILRRISMWKSKWNQDLESEFNALLEFIQDPDELWYCLQSNILPITDEWLCPVCHSAYVKFLGYSGQPWKTVCKDCSPNQRRDKIEKCRQTWVSMSIEQKEDIRQRTQQTLLETYGDAYYGHIGSVSYKENLERKYGNPEYRNQEKIKQTCLERYGFTTNLMTPEARAKALSPETIRKANEERAKTNLAKYGVKAPAQVPEIMAKMIETKRRHVEEFMKEKDCTLCEDLYTRYGQGWIKLNIDYIFYKGNVYVPNRYLPEIESYYLEGSHTNNYTSADEKDVAEFVRSLGFDVEENNTNTVKNRNHKFFELDVFVPSKMVAFDYNGVYWHSSLFKDKEYHMRKSDCCREAGVRLVHIFEDLWYSKRDIYKSIICASLGVFQRRIYARKCEVRQISSDLYKEFLQENHLQGPVNSSLRLGLFYEDELVQVAGWGKSRFGKDEIELHRMCSLLNTQVIGGFSKLIKASNLDSFISYVDLSIHDGHGYLNSGFEVIDKTDPGYVYIKDGIRHSRQEFQKWKLEEKLEKFDPNLSEYENMVNNRYFRVFDSGNLKVIYRRQ